MRFNLLSLIVYEVKRILTRYRIIIQDASSDKAFLCACFTFFTPSALRLLPDHRWQTQITLIIFHVYFNLSHILFLLNPSGDVVHGVPSESEDEGWLPKEFPRF